MWTRWNLSRRLDPLRGCASPTYILSRLSRIGINAVPVFTVRSVGGGVSLSKMADPLRDIRKFTVVDLAWKQLALDIWCDVGKRVALLHIPADVWRRRYWRMPPQQVSENWSFEVVDGHDDEDEGDCERFNQFRWPIACSCPMQLCPTTSFRILPAESMVTSYKPNMRCYGSSTYTCGEWIFMEHCNRTICWHFLLKTVI